MSDTWQLSIEVLAEHAFVFFEKMEPFLDSVSIFEIEGTSMWELTGIIDRKLDTSKIEAAISKLTKELKISTPNLEIELLPETDWVAENRISFPVIRYGRFIIHGSHDRLSVPAHSFKIEVDAGKAFGSGTHGTTEGCIRALAHLGRFFKPNRILDLGCGSGSLSIAAARIWPMSKIVALDIDLDAIVTTQENVKLNKVSRQIKCKKSNGYPNSRPSANKRFDVVIANILAGPLITMAYQTSRWVRKGGVVILSGLLTYQERQVLGAYRARGFQLCKRKHIAGWSTLILQFKGT